MIVGDLKPLEEIRAMLKGVSRVLIAGCGSCVAVCNTGGEKQVEILAAQLRMAGRLDGAAVDVDQATVQRQCEDEFLDALAPAVGEADAVLSLACGAGIQLLARRYPHALVLPGVNTTFLAANVRPGVWEEYCRGCGDCLLGETGGICPIARCSKGLLNGTCGGTTQGMCEVDPENVECGWYLIYKRLKDLGRLDLYAKIRPPRNHARGGGAPRRLCREEMMGIPDEEPAMGCKVEA